MSCCVPNPMCTVRSLKTILVPSTWQGFPSIAIGPSTLTCATIIFVNMCKRDSSRSSLSTSRTKLLMLSPNPWHKMTFNVVVAWCAAREHCKQPKLGSITYVVLWYLFPYYLRTVMSNHGSIMFAWTKSVDNIKSVFLSVKTLFLG